MAEAPSFRWSVRAGGLAEDFGTSIAVDDFGSTFVTGYFRGDSFFDEEDKFTLSSKGEADVFVAKFDRLGNVVWVNQIGGSADDFARGMAIDGVGNCYLTGAFQSRTAEIRTHGGKEKVAEMNRRSDSEIFVAKFDNNGALAWARTAGKRPGRQRQRHHSGC